MLNPPKEIDGAGLLVLQRHDVLRGLGIKLGPALKIYNRYILLMLRAACFKLTSGSAPCRPGDTWSPSPESSGAIKHIASISPTHPLFKLTKDSF
jgi:hypothetical protein